MSSSHAADSQPHTPVKQVAQDWLPSQPYTTTTMDISIPPDIPIPAPPIALASPFHPGTTLGSSSAFKVDRFQDVRNLFAKRQLQRQNSQAVQAGPRRCFCEEELDDEEDIYCSSCKSDSVCILRRIGSNDPVGCCSVRENGCHVVPLFRRKTTNSSDSYESILSLLSFVRRVLLGVWCVYRHQHAYSNRIRYQPQSKSSIALPTHDLGRAQTTTNRPQSGCLVLLSKTCTPRRHVAERNLDILDSICRLDRI